MKRTMALHIGESSLFMGSAASTVSEILKAEAGPGFWLVAALIAGFVIKQATGFFKELFFHLRETKKIDADIMRKQAEQRSRLDSKAKRRKQTRGGQK